MLGLQFEKVMLQHVQQRPMVVHFYESAGHLTLPVFTFMRFWFAVGLFLFVRLAADAVYFLRVSPTPASRPHPPTADFRAFAHLLGDVTVGLSNVKTQLGRLGRLVTFAEEGSSALPGLAVAHVP